MKKKKLEQNQLQLSYSPRTIFGKKLKTLRQKGIIPANIYGQDFKSAAIAVNYKDFYKLYRIARQTKVVHLVEKDINLPVLISHIQKHPVTDQILHVDFRKVDLTKKIQTDVPIKIIGTAEAVSQRNGVLLTLIDHLRIEADPTAIPSHIEIDITPLKDLNQEIKVGDLKPNNFKILDPSDKVIVSVVAHKEESVVPETTVTAPEVITEKKPEEEKSPVKTESEKPVKPTTPPSPPSKN